MQCWRRHTSVSSSWDGWGSLGRAPESSDPSTPALWRASWPAASPPGFGNCPPHCWVGGGLPSLQDIYTRRCTRKARRIIKDSSHPSHRLLSLLPSGRRLRSIRSCTQTTVYLLPLDTIQCTSMILCIWPMSNLLHIRILCAYNVTCAQNVECVHTVYNVYW